MSDCIDGDIRLVGGDTEYEGRVEVCINRVWGTICSRSSHYYWWWSYGWGAPDSNVVCRQLGHMGLGIKVMFSKCIQLNQEPIKTPD